MKNQKEINSLEKRMIDGDHEALAELIKKWDECDNDEESSAYFDALDNSAFLYVASDNREELMEFLFIAKRFGEFKDIGMRLEKMEILIKESIFDRLVKETISKNDPSNNPFADEVDISAEVDLIRKDEMERLKKEFEQLDLWLETARTCLKSPKFSKLSKDNFEFLVEAIYDDINKFASEQEDEDGDEDFDESEGYDCDCGFEHK